MAHADYHCCAVCDTKMAYAGADAETKEDICSRCVAALARQGVIVPNVDALLDYIGRTPKEELQRVLAAVKFNYCRYSNRVDEAVLAKGISEEMLSEEMLKETRSTGHSAERRVFSWRNFNIYIYGGAMIEVVDCLAKPQQRLTMPPEFVRYLLSVFSSAEGEGTGRTESEER